MGRLVNLVRLPLERVAYRSNAEPGLAGKIQYRLTGALRFDKEGIHFTEKVEAKDAASRGVRGAERERTFRLINQRLESNADSIWPSIAELQQK